jgi:hypothetical protein
MLVQNFDSNTFVRVTQFLGRIHEGFSGVIGLRVKYSCSLIGRKYGTNEAL